MNFTNGFTPDSPKITHENSEFILIDCKHDIKATEHKCDYCSFIDHCKGENPVKGTAKCLDRIHSSYYSNSSRRFIWVPYSKEMKEKLCNNKDLGNKTAPRQHLL